MADENKPLDPLAAGIDSGDEQVEKAVDASLKTGETHDLGGAAKAPVRKPGMIAHLAASEETTQGGGNDADDDGDLNNRSKVEGWP